jgi:hypothetical protein
MFILDRDKYRNILKHQGLHEAITALHHDTREWEYNTFEGDEEFDPKDWTHLMEVREFSRELWDTVLK